jgi:hypothetical protein
VTRYRRTADSHEARESIAWPRQAMPLLIAAAVFCTLFIVGGNGPADAADAATAVATEGAAIEPTRVPDHAFITPAPQPGEGEPAPAVHDVPTY